MDINIWDAAIHLQFLITKSADGHPVMKTTKCDIILPSLSVDLCGSARFVNMFNLILMYQIACSWLTWTYGLFQNMIEDKLKETLNLKFCDYITSHTTKLNSVLSSYPCKYS